MGRDRKTRPRDAGSRKARRRRAHPTGGRPEEAKRPGRGPLAWTHLRLGLAVGAGLVLLHAALLVAVFQPAPHSGGDNAAYIALAHALAEGAGYVELWEPGAPAHAKYPPVYPAVLAAVLLLGAVSWTQLKVVSMGFVAAAVLLAFAWVHGRRGVLFAAAVAVLLALSDAFLHASHWVLSEPPFVVFVLLALWAADRADGAPAGAEAAPARAPPWIALAGAAALLAFFTRGAGFPLILAFLVWLALRRAWRPLAVALPAFALPLALWWLRVWRVGEEDYVSEFWMLDPYRPEAGEAGVLDLAGRAGTNLLAYVGTYFPEGLTGAGGGGALLLGLPLFVLALWGWALRARRAPGLAELFAPLYLGLILLWPEVWSGDRFALPLYPLLLFYGGEALLRGVGLVRARVGALKGAAVPWAVGAGAFLLLALPALGAWADRVQATSFCRAQAEREGPWSCHPPGVREFASAAEWSGGNLPDGAVVLSRKPRIFHLLSGLPSRMFPLSAEPELLLQEMERAGASYVLVDWVDAVGFRTLQPAIAARAEAFCHLAGWGEGDAGTNLLALLPEDARPDPDEVQREQEAVFLEPCHEGFLREEPRAAPDRRSGEVPLLAGYARDRFRARDGFP